MFSLSRSRCSSRCGRYNAPAGSVAGVDTVLTAARPTLSDADAIALARACFGVEAARAADLGSERDRTFLLRDGDGAPVAILKASNASEDPEVLDMEAEGALHVPVADPELRVALPWRSAQTGDAGPARPGDLPSSLRAQWSHGPD